MHRDRGGEGLHGDEVGPALAAVWEERRVRPPAQRRRERCARRVPEVDGVAGRDLGVPAAAGSAGRKQHCSSLCDLLRGCDRLAHISRG